MSNQKTRLRKVNTDRIFLWHTKMVRACETILPGRHPSDVIQYLRIGEGLTVEQVADRLGVHIMTVNRWTPPEIVEVKHKTNAAHQAALKKLPKMNSARQKYREDGKRHPWDNYNDMDFRKD